MPELLTIKEAGDWSEQIHDGFNALGVSLSGRAFRSNLFACSSQKGFPLQSLTQNAA